MVYLPFLELSLGWQLSDSQMTWSVWTVPRMHYKQSPCMSVLETAWWLLVLLTRVKWPLSCWAYQHLVCPYHSTAHADTFPLSGTISLWGTGTLILQPRDSIWIQTRVSAVHLETCDCWDRWFQIFRQKWQSSLRWSGPQKLALAQHTNLSLPSLTLHHRTQECPGYRTWTHAHLREKPSPGQLQKRDCWSIFDYCF